ncbi:hypothetical protein Hanom_Chr12g01073951 [Helianthus anomalus]
MKWSPWLIPMLGLYESHYLLSLSQSSQGPPKHVGYDSSFSLFAINVSVLILLISFHITKSNLILGFRQF